MFYPGVEADNRQWGLVVLWTTQILFKSVPMFLRSILPLEWSSSMISEDSNKLSWTQQTFISIKFQMLRSPLPPSPGAGSRRPLDPTVSLIPQETVLCSMINVLEALQHNANQVLWNVVICDKVSKTQKILKAAFKCIYWDNDHSYFVN